MAPKGTSKAQEDTTDIENKLRKRMIESGEWDRIGLIFHAKLTESGWLDDMANRAKELAREQSRQRQLNCTAIMTELTPLAEETVPMSIKNDINAMIRTYMEQNLEK